MNKYKLFMIISIFILIISIGGTIAWYVWTSTDNSSVSLAVCAPEISFIGGDTINGTNLIPVSSKEQGLKKEINVFLNKTCKEGDSGVMNLYMKLDSLPKELQHETFIYEVLKDDEVLFSGNFKDNKEGDVITLLTDEIITETSSIYNIYVYIDGTRENPIEMTNKNFMFTVWGEGTGAIYRENILTNTVSDVTYFLNTDIERSKIKTLTIAEDNTVPEGLTGTPISSISDDSIMLWYTDDDNDSMLDVYIGSKNGIVTLNNSAEMLFYGLINVELLDLSRIDTSNVTSMGSMFDSCTSLKEIKLSNFNTSNTISMSNMFQGCSSLTSIDLSNFDTSNVKNMSAMFYHCKSIKTLDLSHFDTSNVTSMSPSNKYGYSNGMFDGCSSLITLDLTGWKTSNVESFFCMFNGCNSLISLDLSSFDTSKVIDMANMFSNCSKLTSLNLSNFDTSIVTDMGSMFKGCCELTSLDLSNFDTSNVTSMIGMFLDCSELTSLDLSNFDTSNVTKMNHHYGYWYGGGMFQNCGKLKTLVLCDKFTVQGVTCFREMFAGCSSLTFLDLSSFYTLSATDMQSMFEDCSSLTGIDLSNFNTTNVTSMLRMFAGCSSLTSLDLSNFDTLKVTDMRGMFAGCSTLTSLLLTNFDVTNVTLMGDTQYGGMFAGCSSLTSLDLSSFDTSKVTSMLGMFADCPNLTKIDLSNFYTPNLTNITRIFWGDNSLEELYLNSADFSNDEGSYYVFNGVPSTVKVYVKDEQQQSFIIYQSGLPTENVIIAPIVVTT